MNTLYKPCGKEMTVNDNSLSYALSIGWTVEDPTAKVEPEITTKKKATKKAD